MTFDQWKNQAHSIRVRAERVSNSIREEARVLSAQAGLDPSLLGIHPHNAMCSYEAGQPWAGVDYKLVRRVLWLTNEKQWEPTRLADRIIGRLWEKHMGTVR